MKTSNQILSGIILLSLGVTSCKKENAYDATGIFEATTVTVSAETAGKILELPLNEGDSVTIGQRVARIDSSLMVIQREQVSTQRIATASASPDINAQASALRTQIAHQENECRRFRNLLADGATTQKIVDDSEAQLRTLKDQLSALLSTLEKNKASILDNAEAVGLQKDQISEQIRKCCITSPLSGTVLTKYAEPGEYAVPGKPLVKIANLDNIYLRSYFTVSQLSDIRIGQRVTVIADFGQGKTFEYPGTITWISEQSEFTPKSIQTPDSRANMVYAVKVAVRNDGRLKLGQYGEVRL